MTLVITKKKKLKCKTRRTITWLFNTTVKICNGLYRNSMRVDKGRKDLGSSCDEQMKARTVVGKGENKPY